MVDIAGHMAHGVPVLRYVQYTQLYSYPGTAVPKLGTSTRVRPYLVILDFYVDSCLILNLVGHLDVLRGAAFRF
eukprot:SAG31_NODE_18396_length_638_cov_0.749536_1_plen_74_part_00